MSQKHILILGGYGNTGKALCPHLLHHSDCRITIAGRNLAKGQEEATTLQKRFGNRVQALSLDVATGDLKKHLTGVDLVVVASSTSEHVGNVVEACMEKGVDYFDVQLSSKKLEYLKNKKAEIEKSGICCITEGGFHPGLPAALVRYMAKEFDALESAIVTSMLRIPWKKLKFSESTLLEFVKEFEDFQPIFFRDGTWQTASYTSMKDFKKSNFAPYFGTEYCSPMMFEEMRILPKLYPTLKETGFYIAGFHWVIDFFVMPACIIGLKLSPHLLKRLSRLFAYTIRRFAAPPYGTVLKVEGRGKKNNQEHSRTLFFFHTDGYEFTAIPAVAGILQILSGKARKKGLYLMGEVVDPEELVADLQKMGIEKKSS